MNAIEQLKSVLCDPTGKCCIKGSEEDRAIVDRALEALAQRTWVGLTLTEIDAFEKGSLNRQALCCAIEAKLRSKNT